MKTELVRNAMLAVQRYPWEQGVCMQSLYEMGDIKTAVAMAHDAILRQAEDGRFAITGDNIAVTDPAACGEVVLRSYEITGDEKYKNAAARMYEYLMNNAPRTDIGILCHNEISFHEGYTPDQIWADSIYMAPPFLAVMGNHEEAVRQIEGMYDYLKDENSELIYHIYDAGSRRFVRKKLWMTGNGWALMGIGRVLDITTKDNEDDLTNRLIRIFMNILNGLKDRQLPDGRFQDVLDVPIDETFVDGAGAMMMSAAVYRGIASGWLREEYVGMADKVIDTMDQYVDEYGIIHEVCGCPHFLSVGTSAESMAAYLMMHAFRTRIKR